jgi:hypothetical protein
LGVALTPTNQCRAAVIETTYAVGVFAFASTSSAQAAERYFFHYGAQKKAKYLAAVRPEALLSLLA